MKATIQPWSYNCDPKPMGVGPVRTILPRLVVARGSDEEVVAAHPPYPEPVWGKALRPYRETRDGVRVIRLPRWVGRDTPRKRHRQELIYAVALSRPFASSALSFTERPW